MFEILVTVSGITFPTSINRKRFGTVDLSTSVQLGRYNRDGKTGSVISDGKFFALNPDIVTRRGSKIISAEPNKLPESGNWGLVDGAWDICVTAEPKAEPKAEQPKDQKPVAPEDTF